MANKLPVKMFNDTLEKYRPQIKMALPKVISIDRIMRVTMTSVAKNPTLLECTQESLFGAIIQCAQLGLEPGSVLQQAHLVPFRNKRKGGIREVQLIPDYRGLVDLARRSGQIKSINANVVYKGDDFKHEYGLNEDLKHVPGDADEHTEANITHAYAYAKLTDGGQQFVVMTKKDVDMIRNRSLASSSGPWVTDYAEMAKKTVIKRLCKLLPRSVELAQAISLDDRAESGKGSVGIDDFDMDAKAFVSAEDANYTEMDENPPTGRQKAGKPAQAPAELPPQDPPPQPPQKAPTKKPGRPKKKAAAKKQEPDPTTPVITDNSSTFGGPEPLNPPDPLPDDPGPAPPQDQTMTPQEFHNRAVSAPPPPPQGPGPDDPDDDEIDDTIFG